MLKRFKRIVICIAAFILIGIWAVRYCTLNDGFSVKYYANRLYYNMGEIVDFEDNSIGYNKTCNGYSIQVNGVNFYEPDEYLSGKSLSEEYNLIAAPDKIVEIDATLYNSDNETDGVEFYPIELVGKDWSAMYNPEMVAIANPIFENNPEISYGLKVRPGTSYDIKLIYGLRKIYFPEKRWNNIENDEMWLEITNKPDNKLIKLF